MAEETSSEVIEDYVKRMVRESEQNRLHLIDGSPIYDEPLLGFADGDDPLFAQYKAIIGEFHMTPKEALTKATGKPPEKVGVISWILPITTGTRQTMRREKSIPSLRWAHARDDGQNFREFLLAQVLNFLRERGVDAVAPYASPFFQRLVSPTDRSSNWSERHIAYACGLGTFGLSGSLITPKGTAVRFGSIVANLELEPSPRPYASHIANCPFLVNGSCGRCIERCPADAITAEGLDKIKCSEYQRGLSTPDRLKEYGLTGRIGCGFCQSRVPCESAIPKGMLDRSP
ncbi:MAG: epoxyqueuosine reductase [Chloroflexi bacterium]|nr:epoxyqueuosine reductase [Chloroflexota bacterium]